MIHFLPGVQLYFRQGGTDTKLTLFVCFLMFICLLNIYIYIYQECCKRQGNVYFLTGEDVSHNEIFQTDFWFSMFYNNFVTSH